jgi:hypothetical protein
MVPVDVASPEAKILISYTRRTLDAIGIKNGPSHGEVMMTDDGYAFSLLARFEHLSFVSSFAYNISL